MFFAPKFFRGGIPEFLDRDYLIGVDSDHVVKFRGDRPRELGGPLANKKKINITTKTEGLQLGLTVPGGLINGPCKY